MTAAVVVMVVMMVMLVVVMVMVMLMVMVMMTAAANVIVMDVHGIILLVAFLYYYIDISPICQNIYFCRNNPR